MSIDNLDSKSNGLINVFVYFSELVHNSTTPSGSPNPIKTYCFKFDKPFYKEIDSEDGFFGTRGYEVPSLDSANKVYRLLIRNAMYYIKFRFLGGEDLKNLEGVTTNRTENFRALTSEEFRKIIGGPARI